MCVCGALVEHQQTLLPAHRDGDGGYYGYQLGQCVGDQCYSTLQMECQRVQKPQIKYLPTLGGGVNNDPIYVSKQTKLFW